MAVSQRRRLCVSMAGAAASADLGGSSNYSTGTVFVED